MDDRTLFDALNEHVPAARLTRTTDLDTAQEAARNASRRGPSQRRRVWEALKKLGNATDYELGQHLGILRSSAAKRRQELVDRGLVIATPYRRLTDTGSSAVVWRCSYVYPADTLTLDKMIDSSTDRRFTTSTPSLNARQDGDRDRSHDGHAIPETMKAVWGYIERHGTTTHAAIELCPTAAATRPSANRSSSR